MTNEEKDFEEIFPELKESEESKDERIRKELLSVVNDLVLPDEQQSRFVAWLEKQGSQNLANSTKTCKEIPNELEECEIEHGKYYYCIKDYYAGGNKRASKGDVVQALNGMSMMALGVKANEYFMPVNNIEQKIADKCEGCNNAKGCVACVDGSEWAHIDDAVQFVKGYSDDIEYEVLEISFRKSLKDQVRDRMEYLENQRRLQEAQEREKDLAQLERLKEKYGV